VTKPLGWCITLIAVMTAWVFFRAEDLSSAVAMVTTMFSVASFSLGDLADIDFRGLVGGGYFCGLAGPTTHHERSAFTGST
jgi:hypothetical protein